MKKSGFTLIELMIVTLIISLLVLAAIPNVLKIKTIANDIFAQSALKSIAVAMENYLADHDAYPASYDQLMTKTPPYISKNYFVGTYFGFTFDGTMDPTGYSVVATPMIIGQTGTTSYTMTTGAVLQNGS